MRRLSSYLLVIGLLTGWAGTASAATPEYEAAKAIAFSGDMKGFSIPAEPRTVAALNRLWAILSEQALAAMRAHPGQPRAVSAAITKFDPDARGDHGTLSNGFSLLSLQTDEIGTAFLVAGTGAQAHIVWTPSQVGESALRKFPLLAAWRTESARTDCGRRAPYGAGGRCGPLYANGGALPNDAKGRLRFYLDGTYAQAAGMGVSAQISVWQWNGKDAEPLLVVPYHYMIEDSTTHVDGNVLRFRQKDEYKTAFVTAPEVGKQMDGAIRIDPDGAHYLGMSPAIPELAFADGAMWASIEGQPTDAYMSARTSKEMAAIFHAAFAGTKPDKNLPLGELWDSSLRRDASGATVCWKADAVVNVLMLRLEHEGSVFRVAEVESLPAKEDFPCTHKKFAGSSKK